MFGVETVSGRGAALTDMEPACTDGNPIAPPSGATAEGGAHSLARKTGLSAVASAIASGGGFLANVVVARVLGSTGAGVVAFAVWASGTAVLVFGLGIPQALTRYIANDTGQLRTPERTTLMRWYGSVILVGAFALVGAIVLLSRFGLASGVTWAIVVLFGAQAASTLDLAIAAGEQDFARIARRNVAGSVVQALGVSAGAVLLGSVGALLGYACGQAVMARRVPRFLGGTHGPFASPVRADLLWFAGTTWLAALVSLLTWSRLEFIFIARSHAARDVAMYATALSVVQLATQPVTLLSGALLPHFASLARKGADLAAASYKVSTRLLALIAFPLAFGLSATSFQLVHVLFGGAFDGAALPACILAPAAALGAVAAAGSSLVYASGRSRFIALSGIVIGGIAVVTFAIVIPRYGVVGASVARSAVQMLAVFAGLGYVRLRLRAAVPAREILLASGSAATAFIPARLLGAQLGQGWLSLAISGLVFATVCAVLMRVTGALRGDDAEALERIANRAPARYARVLQSGIAWIGGR